MMRYTTFSKDQSSIEANALAECKELLNKYNVKTDDPYSIDCKDECPAFKECRGDF